MRGDRVEQGRPRPWQPRLPARAAYALHAVLRVNGRYKRLAEAIEAHPRAERWFTAREQVVKERLFGCQMCGQCALPSTGYACPMSCPKQLRNGPCGGVSGTGQCEVYPDRRCVWVIAFERAEESGHGNDLDLLQRPVDHRRTEHGTVENPFAPPATFRARRLAKKVAAGAEFVQTQYVFDIGLFARWMAEVRELGVTENCSVIAGVGPIRSLRVLEFMRTDVPGVYVPDHVERRLRGVRSDKVAAEGIDLCVETIRQVADIAGVRGVHVMAVGFEHGIPEIVERAGVGPAARADPVVARSPGDGPAGAVSILEGRDSAG